MTGIGILRASWEDPLNYSTSRDSTTYMVAAILGEAAFTPTTHAMNMTSGQIPGMSRKAETYGAHYVEAV